MLTENFGLTRDYQGSYVCFPMSVAGEPERGHEDSGPTQAFHFCSGQGSARADSLRQRQDIFAWEWVALRPCNDEVLRRRQCARHNLRVRFGRRLCAARART